MLGWLPKRAHNKIHTLVDAQGRPIRLDLTAGQANDAPPALALYDHLATHHRADEKAYDANGIRDLIEAQGAVPNIPEKSNRK